LAVKSKRSLSFEIWVFRNGQPDRDDDRKIFVAMTSTKKQRILVYEIEVQDTTDTQKSASFLDLHLEINSGGRFKKNLRQT
jgi:hypothetical protein